MKKQMVKRGSSCFQNQSPEKRKLLVEFLTNETNNEKWLAYASNKMLMLQRYGLSGCLEAQDFVSDAKVIILELVSVTGAYTSKPRFTITKKGETMLFTQDKLFHYMFLLIKWGLSHKFREDQKTIPLPHWDEDDEGDINSEDDILFYRKNSRSEVIIPFYDQFEENEKERKEELTDAFGDFLEKENKLYRKVFEARLNGKANREIAKKHRISTGRVRNIEKIIARRYTIFNGEEEEPGEVCEEV